MCRMEIRCYQHADNTQVYLSTLNWQREAVKDLSQFLEDVGVCMRRTTLRLNVDKIKWLCIFRPSGTRGLPSSVVNEVAPLQNIWHWCIICGSFWTSSSCLKSRWQLQPGRPLETTFLCAVLQTITHSLIIKLWMVLNGSALRTTQKLQLVQNLSVQAEMDMIPM